MAIDMYEVCKKCKHFTNDYDEILEAGMAFEFDIYIGDVENGGYCKAYKDIVVTWSGNLIVAPECPHFEPKEEV